MIDEKITIVGFSWDTFPLNLTGKQGMVRYISTIFKCKLVCQLPDLKSWAEIEIVLFTEMHQDRFINGPNLTTATGQTICNKSV